MTAYVTRQALHRTLWRWAVGTYAAAVVTVAVLQHGLGVLG